MKTFHTHLQPPTKHTELLNSSLQWDQTPFWMAPLFRSNCDPQIPCSEMSLQLECCEEARSILNAKLASSSAQWWNHSWQASSRYSPYQSSTEGRSFLTFGYSFSHRRFRGPRAKDFVKSAFISKKSLFPSTLANFCCFNIVIFHLYVWNKS